ncbi:HPP family protein [Edaphobacter aggregans]|uniref:HPP family protein n=1 Tax=Edaphobacter aggregans TaxID=570835 RepID=UPI00068D57AB|nr:HPP family protein [Edaphobacter aggregans]
MAGERLAVEEQARHVLELVERLRLTWLLDHLPARLVWSAYMFLNGFMTIALLALLSVATRTPFVFPSLGPTAYLFFFTPLGESSSPRNAVLGHTIGLVCGYGAYIVTGSHGFGGSALQQAHWPEVLAAALSLASTGALMVFYG